MIQIEVKQWAVLGASGGKITTSFFDTRQQAQMVFYRWRIDNPTAQVFLLAVIDGWKEMTPPKNEQN